MGSLNLVDGIDFKREIHYPVKRILAHEWSRVQEIVIAELERFDEPGKSGDSKELAEPEKFAKNLWIGAEIDDWKLAPQFSTHDEKTYHEMLSWVALARTLRVEEGAVPGGGDWPLAARIRMRRGIKRIRIVDWDKLVGNLVIEHIPEIAKFGVHLDPRFDFSQETDVANFLPTAPTESADFLFGDLTDTYDFKKIHPEFLEHTFRIVRPGGFFAFQAGAYGHTADRVAAIKECYADARRAGYTGFWFWHEYIDSFAYPVLFIACWKGTAPSRVPVSSDRFHELFDVSADWPTHYTPEIHQRAFILDGWMKEILASAR